MREPAVGAQEVARLNGAAKYETAKKLANVAMDRSARLGARDAGVELHQ